MKLAKLNLNIGVARGRQWERASTALPIVEAVAARRKVARGQQPGRPRNASPMVEAIAAVCAQRHPFVTTTEPASNATPERRSSGGKRSRLDGSTSLAGRGPTATRRFHVPARCPPGTSRASRDRITSSCLTRMPSSWRVWPPYHLPGVCRVTQETRCVQVTGPPVHRG